MTKKDIDDWLKRIESRIDPPDCELAEVCIELIAVIRALMNTEEV